jgi:hypothetical protein
VQGLYQALNTRLLLQARRVDLFSGAGGLFKEFLKHRSAAIWPEGEAMSDESEVEKVLARGVELSKPLGRVWTVVVLLFSLWTIRKRPGLWTTIASAVAVMVTVWLRVT